MEQNDLNARLDREYKRDYLRYTVRGLEDIKRDLNKLSYDMAVAGIDNSELIPIRRRIINKIKLERSKCDHSGRLYYCTRAMVWRCHDCLAKTNINISRLAVYLDYKEPDYVRYDVNNDEYIITVPVYHLKVRAKSRDKAILEWNKIVEKYALSAKHENRNN